MEASVFFPELSGGLEHQNGADNHDVLREKEKKVHAQHLQYFSTGCEHLR